jgi:fructose-1,6-bisphosphatase I
MITKKTSIEEYILNEPRLSPTMARNLAPLLEHICLACRKIEGALNQPGLEGMLGETGEVNVQEESVKKLDALGNTVFVDALRASRVVCTLVSEEMKEPLHLDQACPHAHFIVCFDPVDGSSNIDINGTVGSIFSIRCKTGMGPEHVAKDALAKGEKQFAAGYVMYGPSTVLGFTCRYGFYCFTLDRSTGKFLMTHDNIRIPPHGKTYSVNEGNSHFWHAQTRRFVEFLRKPDSHTGECRSLRYVGSMVADLHRTLLEGGVFLYPGDDEKANLPGKGKKLYPTGKLRLLYEAAPFALMVEQAGGAATTGTERILDILPTSYHQRVPLLIGSAEDVALGERFHKDQPKT